MSAAGCLLPAAPEELPALPCLPACPPARPPTCLPAVFDVDTDKERAAWEMEGSTDWKADGVDATNGFAFEVGCWASSAFRGLAG